MVTRLLLTDGAIEAEVTYMQGSLANMWVEIKTRTSHVSTEQNIRLRTPEGAGSKHAVHCPKHPDYPPCSKRQGSSTGMI